ncbi:PLP-dependent cysteine synthase family protein [Calidithermus chliarophilus]|uniref:PLP-dependent cysteine synthase family protein n=1 Tax=Calidithermus chliarophilus TaxID=52023 RepID=UPI0004020E1B|nr:cysteine synthase family protein [Calidithermus chliarophilus]
MADVRGSVLEAIGNTPVVELGKVPPAGSARVVVKLEYYNPTGSYKDRMALAMIEEAEKRGDLRPGMSVVEYTGGSTGSSLAFVCAVKGYAFRVVSSDAFAREKLRTMEAFGAHLTLVPSQGGRITPDLIPRMMEKAREMAQEPGTYATDQFNNADSLKGYGRIGLELLEQTGGALDGFCAAVGTAGMAMGVSRALKEAGKRARVVILEPASSAVISTGKAGAHHVEGVGVGFVPPLLDRALYDEAWGIAEQEARAMARRLAREEGIFTGTSGGLNVVGALRLAAALGEGHTVATVVCDSGLKYLAGDLYA